MNDCIICYDEINDLNEELINDLNEELINDIFFSRQCDCEFYIHKKCFKRWIDINYSCPICRTPILIEERIDFHTYDSTNVIIYNEPTIDYIRNGCYISCSIISFICIMNILSSVFYLI